MYQKKIKNYKYDKPHICVKLAFDELDENKEETDKKHEKLKEDDNSEDIQLKF
ncbi:hypothetical protein Glove_132g168 [Diversispora epigaea]|uniref:Uncharacterized protein n=1 Tax=Diversispora epigaea TaxID=1348612 RepID=A0A397J1E2_9GLOM|nr:hypothetical protein Glove_132g168 [Diversispora epigaea]